MPLQTSGQISLNDIHTEVGGGSGTQASINDVDIRGLISKGSATQMSFSEWYGAADGLAWVGDKGVIAAGNTDFFKGQQSDMELVTISVPGNGTLFGNLAQISSTAAAVSNGTRGVFNHAADISTTPPGPNLQYWTFATLSGGSTFGSLSASAIDTGVAEDGTIGLFAGGNQSTYLQDRIEYITIATTGNGTPFGSLGTARGGPGGASDGTRAVFGGGSIGSAGAPLSIVSTVLFATQGNAFGWGSIAGPRGGVAAVSDGSIAAFAGGYDGSAGGGASGYRAEISYMTISTGGSAGSNGSLIQGKSYSVGLENGTTGIFAGGIRTSTYFGTMESLTIATQGNTSSFGTLARNGVSKCACSGS